MTSIVIVDSGIANTASIMTALRSLGVSSIVTDDPLTVATADYAVLPGVGAFEPGLRRLRERKLDIALRDRFEADRPLLAVCLGMQMLGTASAENPGVAGLGILPCTFEPLADGVRTPQLGWNSVRASGGTIPSGDAAFANSFCTTTAPAGWEAAWTTHGSRFASILARGNTLACQFHPELSGQYGLRIISGWLDHQPGGHAKPPTIDASRSARRIVPCLDVKDGRVVKGIRFQEIRDAGDPASRAVLYEAQGADEIVMLDIAATPAGRKTQIETVEAIRRDLRIPLTVGGGVRTVDDARALLAAGADRVSVNTAAVENADLITDLATEFGRQCVVLAVDVRERSGAWEVLVSGGRQRTGLDSRDWIREGVEHGVGEILLTSWDRDGTRTGCDIPLLETMTRAVEVPVIASGGIGSASDAVAAFEAGADAVLAASVFHDGDMTVADFKTLLAQKGISVRR